MFEAWKNLFGQSSLTEEILSEYQQMIALNKVLFEKLTTSLLNNSDASSYESELETKTIELHSLEKKVKRQIVEHLAIKPGNDLATYLSFYGAAQDVERLGSLIHNLHEIVQLQKGEALPEPYSSTLKDMVDTLMVQLDETKKAFEDLSAERVQAIRDTLQKFNDQCAKELEHLLGEPEGIKVGTGIRVALTIRYFKRIGGHLSNLAKSANS